eukprot:6181950-Pleurochrysis_carterae.AAC.1
MSAHRLSHGISIGRRDPRSAPCERRSRCLSQAAASTAFRNGGIRRVVLGDVHVQKMFGLVLHRQLEQLAKHAK